MKEIYGGALIGVEKSGQHMVAEKKKLQNNIHGLIPYDKTKKNVFLSVCERK